MGLGSWIRKRIHGKSLDAADLDRELQTHLELEAEERRQRGAGTEEARFAAMRELGNTAHIKETVHEMRPLAIFDRLRMDTRQAARVILKRPFLSLAIVLTLGICIGAVATVYSAVDATILRSLPYPEPERLAQIVVKTDLDGQTANNMGQDGNAWLAFKPAVSQIDLAISSSGTAGVNFTINGRASFIRQQRVSAGFFRVMGVQPVIGREFTEAEDRAGGPLLAILSHELWLRVFNGDPGIIGQMATITGANYEVIGVAAPGFQAQFGPVDVWTPLRPSNTGEGQGINYHIIGRLRPGAAWAAADAEIRNIGDPLFKFRRFRPEARARYGLVSLQGSMGEGLRTPLLLIMAATALVLLIGCINIAGMLLARGAARSSEIATRIALGAGRAGIVRQLLIENILLGVVAAGVGIAIGYFGIQTLKAQDIGWQILKSAELDWRTLLVTISLSILASLIFGLFPALQAGRLDIRSTQMGRGVIGGGHSMLRKVLPALQVGIAVFLLIGAGLLLRSFGHLWNLEPGFDASNVVTATFSLRDARYSKPEMVQNFIDESLRRLHSVAGVDSAALAMTVPYERGVNTVFEDPLNPAPSATLTNVVSVSDEFFKVLRISLLRGRTFGAQEPATSIVINDAFAQRYFRSREAVGSQIKMGRGLLEIVGVVADTQQKAGWGNFGPMGRVPTVYISVRQGLFSTSSLKWLVRTQAPDAGIERAIEEAVRSVDPLLPIASFQTLQDLKVRAYAWQEFLAATIGLAATLALILSILGMYAMISNAVVERTREFGIRLALGATTVQAILSAVRPGLICAAAGLIAGVSAARLQHKLLQGLLWGVTTTDVSTFLIVPAVVLVVAAAASILPALRISGVDPALTLRQE